MRSYFLIFCSLILLTGCTPRLEKRLTEQLVATPANQADTDKNLILKYAIENKLDVQSTESGLFYVLEKEGSGDLSPDMKSIITAHYHGSLMDGKVFDSSVDRGKPFEFTLGRVIQGWQEGIPLLKKGGKGKFLIPSAMAYGERGAGKDILPNSVLIFDIELIDFMDPKDRASKEKEKQNQSILNFAKENGFETQRTTSGLHYVVLKEGTGDARPDKNSKVKAHYHGTLLNGTVFDSSVDRGEPFEFSLGRVIPGWQEGIALMNKGSKYKFLIPSHLAYGQRGAGGVIKPNSILIFDVELLDF